MQPATHIVPDQQWFTTAEAAEYIRTTPKALGMMVTRKKIIPDAFGSRGGGFRGHRFARATLDAYLLRHGKA